MTVKVNELLREKYWIARPLQVINEDNESVRLNVVTDDISKRSLLGGVATALILATLLCNENDWGIRIITRYVPCDLKDYYDFLDLYQLAAPKKVEAYSDEKRDNAAINYMLPVSKNDIFMATSWWSAKSILDTKIRNRILYIIQEEETFFYAYGDERYQCEKIMKSNNIDYIVNSKLLFDYLKKHGYDVLCKNGLYFEPAFPKHLYCASDESFSSKKGEKRKLFFYGRPHNPRNIYYFGLECLDEALKRGVIDTDLWDIYMAGYNDMGEIEFSTGYRPKMNGQMDWNDYAAFSKTVDVALSLMYTPHPSYPPFDMCCSGAVVVTNEFENKKDLSYSDNMLVMPLEKEAIILGIEKGIKLAQDSDQRRKNYDSMNIGRDWNSNFKEIVSTISERARNGRYV